MEHETDMIGDQENKNVAQNGVKQSMADSSGKKLSPNRITFNSNHQPANPVYQDVDRVTIIKDAS